MVFHICKIGVSNFLMVALLISGRTLCAQEQASLILYNAKIITLDDNNPSAEAIAVFKDKIIAVGPNVDIMKIKSAYTLLVNVQGKTIIPGLFDSHLHVIRAGRFYNTELRWDGVSTLKRALQMIREQAAGTPKGQWVRVVGGWNEYQFAEKRIPTLAEINAATGETPAFIMYLYGQAFLHKKGLKELNINENTPNPPGGLIQKDADGQPTGLLMAEPNAFILYSTLSKLPELNTAEKINSIKLYMSELNMLGVTSVIDAGGGFQNFPDDYKITDSLSKLGQLTVRLPYYLFAQKAGSELVDYQCWIGMVNIDQHESEYFVQGGRENLVLSGGDFENFLKPRPELPATMERELKDMLLLLVKK